MPTIWEHGPYRFFIYSADRMNRRTCMSNVKETKQNLGSTQYACKTVAGSAELN